MTSKSRSEQQRRQASADSGTPRLVTVSNLIAAAAAFAAMITSLYTLLYLVRPNLKPPEKLNASISEIKIEEQVSYPDYLRRSGRPDLGTGRDAVGTLFFIELDIQGIPTRNYGTFMTLMDSKTKRSIIADIETDSQRYQPQVASDKVAIYAWIEQPKAMTGRYFVRVRLYDQAPQKRLQLLSSSRQGHTC